MKPEIQTEDLEIALPILKTINPKIIVEIGTYFGGSVKLWRDTFKPTTLITIDIKAWASPIDDVEYVIGSSHDKPDEVKKLLKGKEIDFLFIDGDHRAEAVTKDFELYLPLVRQGGLIMFHDVIYRNAENDVPTLWKEIKRNYNYVEIAMNNNTTGVGIITKDSPYERTEHGNVT